MTMAFNLGLRPRLGLVAESWSTRARVIVNKMECYQSMK